MFQRKQRRISEKIKSTLDSDALPFHEILDADMVESAMASEGVQSKDRIYTPFVTLCLFLSQVLDQDHSCRAAVMRLILWMALNDRKPCSSETTSYCDARQRLPLEVIVRLVHATAEKIEAGASDDWLWKGRRVSLVDGMTASMPDKVEKPVERAADADIAAVVIACRSARDRLIVLLMARAGLRRGEVAGLRRSRCAPAGRLAGRWGATPCGRTCTWCAVAITRTGRGPSRGGSGRRRWIS